MANNNFRMFDQDIKEYARKEPPQKSDRQGSVMYIIIQWYIGLSEDDRKRIYTISDFAVMAGGMTKMGSLSMLEFAAKVLLLNDKHKIF